VREGKAPAALRALERSLEVPGWVNQARRGFLLAHIAIVAVAAEQIDRAKLALQELDTHPELSSTPALQASVLRARGELAFAEERPDEAAGLLRQALRLWQEIGSPLNVAGLRVRLAELLADGGDDDTADLELSAAESLFRQVGANELSESCADMRRALVVSREK